MPGSPLYCSSCPSTTPCEGTTCRIKLSRQASRFVHYVRLCCAAATDDGAKYYVLRSYLPKAVRRDFVQRRAPDALPTQAFELTVLALIVMNGDRISDGMLASHSADHLSRSWLSMRHWKQWYTPNFCSS
jgi:hypothetical protein